MHPPPAHPPPNPPCLPPPPTLVRPPPPPPPPAPAPPPPARPPRPPHPPQPQRGSRLHDPRGDHRARPPTQRPVTHHPAARCLHARVGAGVTKNGIKRSTADLGHPGPHPSQRKKSPPTAQDRPDDPGGRDPVTGGAPSR